MPVDDDDLDALAAVDGPRHKECGVHYGLRSLPPDTRAKMIAALANHSADPAAISAAFARRGMTVEAAAIQRHRRPTGRGCKCHECDCGECV